MPLNLESDALLFGAVDLKTWGTLVKSPPQNGAYSVVNTVSPGRLLSLKMASARARIAPCYVVNLIG